MTARKSITLVSTMDMIIAVGKVFPGVLTSPAKAPKQSYLQIRTDSEMYPQQPSKHEVEANILLRHRLSGTGEDRQLK